MDKEQAIKDAIFVAEHGTKEEKEDFVEWACTAINWLSAQPDKESKDKLHIIEAQYKAYLQALNGTKA